MIFKLILIGDSSVGKANILSKYLHNEFNLISRETEVVNLRRKNFSIKNNIVKTEIFDTSWQEKFNSISQISFRGAKGSFIVFELTNKSTFESVDKLMSDIMNNDDIGDDMSIILLENKPDLKEQRQVTVQEAKQNSRII